MDWVYELADKPVLTFQKDVLSFSKVNRELQELMMKALRLHSPKNLAIEHVHPARIHPGWVRIGVERVGVCGSDLASIAGNLPFTKFPINPGHELSGIITEVNTCKKAAVGQGVTANPIFHCGMCSGCLTGNI